MLKAARLAALFFCQPSGGPAVAGGKPATNRRDGGHTAEEATFRELVKHWHEWSPTEYNVPQSVFNTRPFQTPLNPSRFPAVPDGSGDGAIHSELSGNFVNFLRRGNDHKELSVWRELRYLLPR
eukprot:2842382-Pyramimonas_sp.AAC.1